jgi:hypothetical protein
MMKLDFLVPVVLDTPFLWYLSTCLAVKNSVTSSILKLACVDTLLSHLKPLFENADATLYYDINSKYQVHYSNMSSNSNLYYIIRDKKLLLNVDDFRIDSFHVLAHKSIDCQRMDPLYSPNCGNTKGEAIERTWGPISGASLILKNSGKDTRIELLEDIFLYLWRRKWWKTW